MTTPTHTMPAKRPVRASAIAACGSSNEPGTQWTSMRSRATPPDSSAEAAPSASFFEIDSLNRAATTAKRPTGARRTRRLGFGADPAISIRQRGEEVAHLLALGHQVALVALGGRNLDRHALAHLQPVPLDADDLLRIVREDAQAPRSENDANLRADAVVPQVGLEAEDVVGLDGVLALVLDRKSTRLNSSHHRI